VFPNIDVGADPGQADDHTHAQPRNLGCHGDFQPQQV
jgi:hypothetical protein